MNFIVAQILKYTRKIRSDYKTFCFENENFDHNDLLVYDEV